ncbi:MAG: formylglycine-generating enzyme family protein [Treponema sp.]|nr:formylglycine-generating enzyme family protein [Treponema sp.]
MAKNKIYRYVYAGIALVMAWFIEGCAGSKPAQTAPEPPQKQRNTNAPAPRSESVIENSRGYKAEESELKNPPQWVQNGEESLPKTKGPYYFQAKGEGSTIAEASRIAENEVKRQIGSYILSPLQVEAAVEGETRTIKDSQKTSRETKEELAEQDYIIKWIQSSASFSDVHWEDDYWERHKTGNTETIRYWVRYSITEEHVAAARSQITRQYDIAQKEADDFIKLKDRLEKVLSLLERLSFLDQENQYRKQYENLLIIQTQWQELTTLREHPDYIKKGNELTAGIRYYDPTDSKRQIKQENERLRIQQEIAINERKLLEEQYQSGGGVHKNDGSVPVSRFTQLTVGTTRLQIGKMVTNGDFSSFLDSTDRPNLFARNLVKDNPAVNVSWLEAVLYCNWLSAREGLGAYYIVTEKRVQTGGDRKGYRLLTMEEINRGLDRKVIKPEDVTYTAVLSSESDKAYRFDPGTQELRAVDSSFPTNNIGFMVVRQY